MHCKKFFPSFLILFLISALHVSLSAQYERTIKTLDMPSMELDSLHSYIAIGEDYCAIIENSDGEYFFTRINKNNEVYQIDEIPVSPSSFAFVNEQIFYFEGKDLNIYDFSQGIIETHSFPDSLGESYSFEHILRVGDNVVLAHESEVDTISGLVLINPTTLEIINTYSSNSNNSFKYLKETDNGFQTERQGSSYWVDINLFVSNTIQLKFDNNLEVFQSIVNRKECHVGHNNIDYTHLTYHKDGFISESVEYTPFDNTIFTLRASSCEGSMMSTVMGSGFFYTPAQGAYKIDESYFLMTSGSKLRVYDCHFQIMNTYEDTPTFKQNINGLYNLSLLNDSLVLERIGYNYRCTTAILTSQEQIDTFNLCESLLGDLIINDGLDGEYDITSLANLEDIINVTGNIEIINNPQLNSLSFFNENLSIKDTLKIMDNEKLLECSASFICNHIAAEKKYLVYNNGAMCSDSLSILSGCDGLCPDDVLVIRSCVAASEFANNYPYCEELKHGITIMPQTNIYGEIENGLYLYFAPLQQIKKVNGNVTINTVSAFDEPILNIEEISGTLSCTIGDNYNSLVSQATQFPYLKSVGGLNVSISPIANGSYFEGDFDFSLLEYIGHLYVSYLTGVKLDFLKNFNNVPGNITINESDFKNLSFLSSLDSIGGDFKISSNDLIENLVGLEGLKHVEGDFAIWYSDALVNLEGLENLDSIGGYFSLFGNAEILDLEELDDLVFIGGRVGLTDISIRDNPKLSNCAIDVICEKFDEEDVLDIRDNTGDCIDTTAVRNVCLSMIDEDGDGYSAMEDCNDMDANIYPFAEEIQDNGIDDDCNPLTLDTYHLPSMAIDNSQVIDSNGEYLIISSTNSTTLSQIKIYPNPVRDKLYFSNIEGITHLELFSIEGRKIELQLINNFIDLEGFANGLYICKIHFMDMQTVSKKFIIKH